ncbi:MAG TPA: integrin alpha [Phycisphaerae bacterium]|nr:integrin alpha [Phycisphaerae bacterium]
MNARCNSHPIWATAKTIFALPTALTAALLLTAAQPAAAQPGWVLSHQKISDTEGGFTGILDDVDFFGYSVASLGDLDGDGVGDLAVGASEDDDGGAYGGYGAVWVLFLNADGTVKSHQKISATEGGFTGILDDHGNFGYSLAPLGDLDGDGVADLAVGNVQDNDGGSFRGAVWVLFLNTDGTVKSHQKISDTQGGFTGILDNGDRFGSAVASMGDHDGDGVGDLAVAAFEDTDGGSGRGAVWVLFLNTDGTVKSHQKISDTQGGFTGIMDDWDYFGWSVGSLGDLDGDGVGDLAVGAVGDDDGGNMHGAVWVLFLNTDGTVKSHQKISDTQGGFAGILDRDDWFGYSVPSLGDLDGDGVGDVAVGAAGDDDGGAQRGAVWVLFLNPDGTVKSHQKISATEGGFTGILGDNDWFGTSTASLSDLDGDGVGELAVGARGDDDGGVNRGAVWVLFLDGVPACPGDLNGDGCVDQADLGILLADWGCVGGDCPGDCDNDGDTDHADLGILLAHWGEGCP